MTILKTVTFSQSVPLRKEGDKDVMKDTIQTYYDMTEPAIKKLAEKFPGLDFTIEKQSRALGKMPKIETSESYLSMKRYPSVPRSDQEKIGGGAFKKQSGTFAATPAPASAPAKSADYSTLVNTMMQEAS